jgi:hypothetical protein
MSQVIGMPVEYEPSVPVGDMCAECFELDASGLIGAVDATGTTLSAFHADIDPESREISCNPTRVLSEQAMQQLVVEAATRQEVLTTHGATQTSRTHSWRSCCACRHSCA